MFNATIVAEFLDATEIFGATIVAVYNTTVVANVLLLWSG